MALIFGPAHNREVVDPIIPEPEGTGDFRGSYGYGRAAHGSDAGARYGFDRHPHTLPPHGAPSMPGLALEERPAASEAGDVVQDQTVFRA
jgi:hypothetical protein